MTQTAPHPSLEILQELLVINVDAAKFYEATSALAKSEAFKKSLGDFLTQRKIWINDLQTRIATANRDPQESGTLLGKLQRGWLDLRGRINATDDLSLLGEVLESEEEIRRRYEAVRVRIDGPMAALVQRQYEGLLATGRALHALKARLTSERSDPASSDEGVHGA
jgi:uncharacterized protein (TIGR02284 family)